MKKLLIFFCLFIVPFLAFADNSCCAKPCEKPICKKTCCVRSCCDPNEFYLVLKPAYFFPQSKTIRDIYCKHGWLMYELEGGMSLLSRTPCCKHNFYIYTEVGGFVKNGKQSEANAHCSIYTIPVALGFKYAYMLSCWCDLFVKAAPNWVYVHEHTDSPYVESSVHKSVCGATVGIGSRFSFCKHGIIDVFADYLWDHRKYTDPNSKDRISLWAGGLVAGVGIGFKF